MLVEIVKSIRWFLFIMLLSILATWNAFTLLLTRACAQPDAASACESPRDPASAFRTMFDMVNTLMFGNGNLDSLERTEYFGLVVPIFIVSMIAMPIVLLNMLIAIMNHSYDQIHVRLADAQCRMHDNATSGLKLLTILQLMFLAASHLTPLQELSKKEAFRMKAKIILVAFYTCTCASIP
jgi:hypothetical protein